MNLHDARSYFSQDFEHQLVDDAALERQLYLHRMEDDHVLKAILELAAFARMVERARKASPAARTQSGLTALEHVWSGRSPFGYCPTPADEPVSWGWLSLNVRRTHKRAGVRVDRVLNQLERDGVLEVRYGYEFGRQERTDKVTVEIADAMLERRLPLSMVRWFLAQPHVLARLEAAERDRYPGVISCRVDESAGQRSAFDRQLDSFAERQASAIGGSR